MYWDVVEVKPEPDYRLFINSKTDSRDMCGCHEKSQRVYSHLC